MAHEMKTPLTSMIGYTDLLRRSQLPPESAQQALDAIVSQGEGLERMAFKLLDLSLLDSGIKPQMQPCDVSALFEEAQAAVAALSAERGVRVVCQADMETLVCDRDLIGTMLQNLLSNAIKASGAGQDVVLSARDGVLSVTDHGVGIPAEHLARVTEPFYMVDKSRARSQQGAGLGLALCRRIARLHGAQLVIESREGAGTRVSVSFTSRIYPDGTDDTSPPDDDPGIKHEEGSSS